MRPPLEVFAVEDTAVQLTWPDGFGGAEQRVEAGPSAAVIDGRTAGAVVLDGLEPATRYRLCVNASDAGSFVTLPSPPGRPLTRLATVNDIHIGERSGGSPFFVHDRHPLPDGVEPYPARCVRAAIAEALSWGAELIVVKGDVTRASAPVEFAEAAGLLSGLPVPVEIILGNHDVVDRAVDGSRELAQYGFRVPQRPWARDVPGLRLVFGQTSYGDRKRGGVGGGQLEGMVGLVRAAGGPCLVFIHHQLQRWSLPLYYPPGIPGPEARQLAAALIAANPDTLLAAGHTHRTRAYRIGPLIATEVASTKDYPGVWAGYAVHEGGIRQVVRRIAAPDAISWTEQTRNSLFGVWRRWASGRLTQRCFVHQWTGARVVEP